MHRAESPSASPRRTVATRVLASYAIIMVAFALAAGWSVWAQRTAAHEASLMRSGYFPLALAVRDLVANQNTWNTQLNHITAARNPADIRVWFDIALRIGRPRLFREVEGALSAAFIGSEDPNTRRLGEELLREIAGIEMLLADDADPLNRLFEALDRRDANVAERLRDELVVRGSQSSKRLDALEQRVGRHVDMLLDRARARERFAIELLAALAVLTLLVGAAMAFYSRRVLAPLALVTERAVAVAQGDLIARPAIVSNDEIGELSTTFEGMVAAIARANEQLLSSERLATIGKMAAHVTHEIRNPLSSIALNVELLEEDLGSASDESRALLRAIRQEVERLTALSAEYLSFARRQPLRLEDEDIAELVRESCEFMRRDLERQGARLVVYAEPGHRAAVDETQLKQALFNLIRNAREAMPSGGEITVTVQGSAEGHTEIVIDDQGTGLDEATRARLFEPFFTTKSHGTGLGLAITRQIVEAHGGVLELLPRPGGGTRVRLELSSEPAPAPSELDARASA